MSITLEDERFDTCEIKSMNGKVIRTISVCNHVEVVPVISGGQLVARLCVTCDAQFTEDFRTL